MEIVERFRKAYEYLYNTGIVHTKKDLAEKMKVSRGSVQNAYAGNESYLNESFMRKLARTFPDVFNLDWLLTGSGEMLKSSQMPQEDTKDVQPTSMQPDIQKWLMKQNEELVALLKQAQATIDRKDHELSELRKELKGDGVIASQKTVKELDMN